MRVADKIVTVVQVYMGAHGAPFSIIAKFLNTFLH